MLCVQPTPPPSEKALYESTVVWTDVDDPDQAFSLLGSLCEAGVETNNPCDFIFRAFFILSGTWPVTVFLVGLLALPSHDNYWTVEVLSLTLGPAETTFPSQTRAVDGNTLII
ncbi:hypothetical protein C0Q70_05594 [Pomacea canaliculata]|uniref:Uncharacterized protein n=1 Tax=Pomacea canaliculata TaxID=400727 RepID=A0A2T7PLL5_POMCA|nr:hypothetical protein C0Q70_05594 [Pomacea canaliculata]